jgi:AraC-like DNA-binding protein
MLVNSLVTNVKMNCAAEPTQAVEPRCIFWTNQAEQMSVQNYCPGEEVHFQPHTYSEYTLVVCLEGEIIKTQFGQTFSIGRGGSIISNPGVEHSSGYLTRHGKQCEAVSLSLDRRVLAALAAEFHLPPVNQEFCAAFTGSIENSVLYDCARNIAEEMRNARPGHKIVIETLATRLLVGALRSWPRANIAKIETDHSPRLPRKDFVRAYEFMRWCRKDNFRLQQLCQFLGCSEERFARLFLGSTKHTPASFYNRMLLERARDLLANQKLSVKEIGFDLGYKTSSHFIAAFRREFAASPQEYRQISLQS